MLISAAVKTYHMYLAVQRRDLLKARAIRICIIVSMKKTLHIDEQLLRDAKSAAGAKTDTDTVRLGLEALIRRAAYERLRALRGSEPRARDIRRRRERSSSARHSAA
jgi:Arc/MetJ family transcription regulator